MDEGDERDISNELGVEKNILYDRLVHVEWPEATTILATSKGLAYLWKSIATAVNDCLRFSLEKVKRPLHLFGLVSGTPSAVIKILDSRLPWRLAITSDGILLGVLKEEVIEIRNLADRFERARTNILVGRDTRPQWRQLLWNEEGSLLAYGTSGGLVKVFSSSGSLLGQFGGVAGEEAVLGQAIASMVFMPRQKSDAENVLSLLCVLLYGGSLDTYQISSAGPVHLHSFSFTNYFPEGVACMVYLNNHNLLLVGGASCPSQGEGCGISGWRLLDGAPYWGPKVGQMMEKVKKGYISGLISRKRNSKLKSTMIVDMSLSPSGASLATIDVAGNLSIVEVPSFQRKKLWSLQELPASTNLQDDEGSNKVSPLPIQVSWWSEEAVILANEAGEVSVLSINSLSNLLSGGHLTGWSITPASNEQFHYLECDTKYDSFVRRSRVPSLSEDSERETDDEEQEDSFSLSRFSSNLVKQALYFITDSERFRTNTKRKMRTMTKKYRLTCIKAITPTECYERKLRAEDYEEALQLAREYDLDSDLVFQKQWENYQVSPTTIKDYLSQVSKRSWVLHECLNRTTTDYTSTRNLLEYGLTRTSFQELKDLGEEMEQLHDESSSAADSSGADRLETVVEALAQVERLSPEQVSLCQYRNMLLCYLDRLDTYEVILHGPAVVEKVFQSKEHEVFRSLNLVQAAVSYAREGEWGALEALFTYHGSVLLPHRLAILFNFPETTPPKVYRSLLPAVSAEGDVIGWQQQCHRDMDWVESEIVRKLCSLPDETMSNHADFIYEENSEWKRFMGPFSVDDITLWYITRATEIEEFSGQVDSALQLIELGVERGVKGLTECHHELKTLSTLVYQCNVDSRLNLKKFKALTDLEVVELMMKDEMLMDRPESGFVSGLEKWVLPYLSRLDSITANRSRGLLKNYLTRLSKGGLEPCLSVLQQSNAVADADVGGGEEDSCVPVISSVRDRIELSISCIYACDRNDQLNIADQIVECLPSRTHESSSEDDSELHDQVDMLENYISAAEILQSYGISRPVRFIRDMQGSSEEAQQLMVMLTRAASRRQPPMDKEAWQVLLEHLLSLRDTIFSFVDQVTCYKIYTESLLCSGEQANIHLATSHLSLTPPPGRGLEAPASGEGLKFKLSYEASVELVVGVAKEYFNSAANMMDREMDLARACLGLFPLPCPDVQRELSLIASLSLLDDFSVSMLPVQVRLCENKLDMVRAVLDSSPSAYKKHDKILRLCKLLDSEESADDMAVAPSSLGGGEEVGMSLDQGHSIILIVLTALERQDYRLALQLCSQLTRVQFSPAWEICRMMGMDARVGDHSTRLKLLDFSITHCPPEEIAPLLQSKQILKLQTHYAQCGVGGDVETSEGVATSRRRGEGRQSLVGRSVQQLVSRGAGAVQHFIGARSSSTSEFRSPEAVISRYLSSLRAAAAHIDSGVVEPEQTLQLCYHPFYSTNPKELFTYESSGRQSVDRKVFLLQTLLRSCLLLTSCSEHSKQSGECGQVLLKLADLSLRRDVLLSVGYLLAVDELQDFDEWLSNSVCTKLSLELILYCISLHLYNLSTLTTPDAPPPYLYPPSALICHMTSVVESHSGSWTNQQQVWVDLLHKYQQSLADHSQGLVLQKLGLGVDVDLFAQDNQYKKTIILTLARSSDSKLFSTALSLGQRHGIDTWEIYITLLDSLLTTSNSSVAEIERKIEERDIMKCIMDEPQKSADYLRETTYPDLPGLKYGILLLYYSILQKCMDKGAEVHEAVSVEVHVKLLSKFKSALHGVDYKVLMSGEEGRDPLIMLTPALTQNNVHVIARLAGKIPCAGRTVLTQGMVLCAFALKMFWKGKEKQSAKIAKVDWLERYESCVEYLNLLMPAELHHFVLGSALSEKSLQLPIDMRCELIAQALELCGKQTSADKSSTKSEMSHEELAELLKGYLKHLRNLSQLNLQQGDSPEDVQRFMIKFDLSLSEIKKVGSLVLEMILSGQSPENVDSVLKLSHSVCPHQLSAAALYKEALQSSLSSSGQAETSQAEATGQLEVILKSVSEHESAGGSVVSSADVLDVLRPFCSDSSNVANARKRLFMLVEKYLFLSSEDQHLLLYYQTEALLSNVFHREITLEDVYDSSSQRELFCSLLGSGTASEKHCTLCSLLDSWQDSLGASLAAQCWIDLLESVASETAPVEVAVLIRAGLTEVPSEVDEKLFSYVFNTSTCEGLKYSIVCGNEQMFEKALNQLELDSSAYHHDVDLLEMLLFAKKFLSLRNSKSILYDHLCHYLKDTQTEEPSVALFARLLRCPEDDVLERLGFRNRAERVKGVAKQLYDGGFVMEAGAILVSSQSFHSALATFNDSLAYVTELFRKQ